MTGQVFVDTNIFIYLYDDSEPDNKLCADNWIICLVAQCSSRLSFQPSRELYAVLTYKVQPTSLSSLPVTSP